MTKTKNKSIIYVVLALVMSLGLMFLGSACGETTRTFTMEEGLTITLPSKFSQENEEYGYSFSSKEAIVDVTVWTKENLLWNGLVFDTTTPVEFATYMAVMDNLGQATNSGFVQTSSSGYAYYTNSQYSSENGARIFLTYFVVKEKDKFFTLDMYCFESDRDKYRNTFHEWMQTAEYEHGTTANIEEKEFDFTDLKITLANNFTDITESTDEQSFVVGSGYTFTFTKEVITEDNQDTTLDQYAQNDAGSATVQKQDDLTFCEFSANLQNVSYKMATFYFKGEKNFYACSFYCPTSLYNQTKVIDFAKTIQIEPSSQEPPVIQPPVEEGTI